MWVTAQQFGVPAQHCQGRTQFVRGVPHESLLRIPGGLQAAQHVVEGAGQATEFVLILPGGNALPQVAAASDAPRGVHHAFHRAQHRPGQPPAEQEHRQHRQAHDGQQHAGQLPGRVVQ